MQEDHQVALVDHCDGVEDADRPWGSPRAVAIGLDWRTALREDFEDPMILARAWSFNKLAFGEPSPT